MRFVLPTSAMLFGETDQVNDRNNISTVGNHFPGIVPKHLVDFAGDEHQIRAGEALLKRHELKIQASLRVSKLPWLHVVTRIVSKIDLFELVDTTIQDQAVFCGYRGITKPPTHVKPQRASIWKET